MKKGVSGDRNSGFFKKRNTIARPALDVRITEEEASLAQSNYNVEKITEIQSRFTGGEVLLVPGRLFIREGPLWKVCRKNVKKRQFFLFNDILVYGSNVANRWNNQHILPLSKMSASSRCEYTKDLSLQFSQEQLGEGLDASNAFQVNHMEKSFHVVAISAADKNNWLSNLAKYIKKASPQDTAVETRAIWVPDSLAKDCMVCGTKFSAFIRKHHCRKCGRVVCSTCSPHRLDLCPRGSFVGPAEERVCNQCFQQKNGNTLSVPSPHPASTVLVTPLNTTPSESPDTSDLENESTDTEDTDDSGEVNTPSQAQEAPPLMKDALPVTLVAYPTSVPSTSLCPPSTEEDEKRPTPPPRKKKMKAHSTVAPGGVVIEDVALQAAACLDSVQESGPNELSDVGVPTVAIGDVKGSLDLPHPPEERSEQTVTVGKEVQRTHHRRKKFFSESQGTQNSSSRRQETSPEANETFLKSSQMSSENESFGNTSRNEETSSSAAGDKDFSQGGTDPFLGGKDSHQEGKDSSPVGRDSSPVDRGRDSPGFPKLAQDIAEPLLEQSSSHTHFPTQHIQDSTCTSNRKSARRRQKFVVDLTS